MVSLIIIKDGQCSHVSNQNSLQLVCQFEKHPGRLIILSNANFSTSVLHARFMDANVARPPLTQWNTFFLNSLGTLHAVQGFQFIESALKSLAFRRIVLIGSFALQCFSCVFGSQLPRILRSSFESSFTSDLHPPATLPRWTRRNSEPKW